MLFYFEKFNGGWRHDDELYSGENLLVHYRNSHKGEVTSGKISPLEVISHLRMSRKIGAIREEHFRLQKEREAFFVSRSIK